MSKTRKFQLTEEPKMALDLNDPAVQGFMLQAQIEEAADLAVVTEGNQIKAICQESGCTWMTPPANSRNADWAMELRAEMSVHAHDVHGIELVFDSKNHLVKPEAAPVVELEPVIEAPKQEKPKKSFECEFCHKTWERKVDRNKHLKTCAAKIEAEEAAAAAEAMVQQVVEEQPVEEQPAPVEEAPVVEAPTVVETAPVPEMPAPIGLSELREAMANVRDLLDSLTGMKREVEAERKAYRDQVYSVFVEVEDLRKEIENAKELIIDLDVLKVFDHPGIQLKAAEAIKGLEVVIGMATLRMASLKASKAYREGQDVAKDVKAEREAEAKRIAKAKIDNGEKADKHNHAQQVEADKMADAWLNRQKVNMERLLNGMDRIYFRPYVKDEGLQAPTSILFVEWVAREANGRIAQLKRERAESGEGEVIGKVTAEESVRITAQAMFDRLMELEFDTEMDVPYDGTLQSVDETTGELVEKKAQFFGYASLNLNPYIIDVVGAIKQHKTLNYAYRQQNDGKDLSYEESLLIPSVANLLGRKTVAIGTVGQKILTPNIRRVRPSKEEAQTLFENNVSMTAIEAAFAKALDRKKNEGTKREKPMDTHVNRNSRNGRRNNRR